jgi:hypothetical protein
VLPLEAMLADVNRRLKRGKAFDAGRVQGRLVAALDGIEVLSSFSRRCEFCLERRVTRKDQAGRKIEETQYYHRAVGCLNTVGSTDKDNGRERDPDESLHLPATVTLT